MRRFAAILLALALALTTVALAEVRDYEDPDKSFTFKYDSGKFEITEDDHEDDAHVVCLSSVDPAWDGAFIQFVWARDDEDAEARAEALAEIEAATGKPVEKGEWNGFQDVTMFDIGEDGEYFEQTFIIPIAVEPYTLSIVVGAGKLEDEEIAMARDDAISGVLDTLEIIPFAG